MKKEKNREESEKELRKLSLEKFFDNIADIFQEGCVSLVFDIDKGEIRVSGLDGYFPDSYAG